MDLNGLKRVLCLFGLLAVMSPLVGCPGALIGRSGPQEPKLFFGVPAVEEKTEFSWWDWEKHLSLSPQRYGGPFQEDGSQS